MSEHWVSASGLQRGKYDGGGKNGEATWDVLTIS
jgi:hypothetical protein